MNALETQVGQVYINNKKLSKSFVWLMSEKLQTSETEIYTIMEAPVLPGLPSTEYEKVAKGLLGVLRKNMLLANENSFENAIAQINDDLSKLAEKGWAAWIGKVNACIAARRSDKLYVATTGKIHAYLFRDRQFSDIADLPKTTNPLKVFQNFAAGKVAKKDFVIFTTNQLFNFISIERLKEVLGRSSLQEGCAAIADIVTQIADETVSFGTFIVEVGTVGSISTEQYKQEFVPTSSNPTIAKAQEYFATAATVSLPILQKLKGYVLTAWSKLKGLRNADFSKVKNLNLKDLSPVLLAQKTKELANMEKIKQLPKMKKFFLISAAVFLVILIINIAVATNLRGNKRDAESAAKTLTEAQISISDANTAYIYNDKAGAFNILQAAKAKLDALEIEEFSGSEDLKKQKAELQSEITSLLNSIGGLNTANVREVANTNNGDIRRILLSGNMLYISNASANTFLPYSTSGEASEVSRINNASAANADAINIADNTIYFVDANGSIYKVSVSGATTEQQAANIGSGTNTLIFYGTPAKPYVLNREKNNIFSMEISSTGSPVGYLKQSLDLSQSLDMAIDSAIYVLFPDRIEKLSTGTVQPFTNAGIKYSANAKIRTNNNLSAIYILDPGAKKIIVLNKRGELTAQYVSESFTDLKDMVVASDGKKAYLLNGTQILEVIF